MMKLKNRLSSIALAVAIGASSIAGVAAIDAPIADADHQRECFAVWWSETYNLLLVECWYGDNGPFYEWVDPFAGV